MWPADVRTRRDETTVALLTPPLRGALASIAVEGPRAVELVGDQLQSSGTRPLRDLEPGRILFARWPLRSTDEGATPIEEVVVCQVAAQRVEVHCHGGPIVAAALVRSLVAGGAREIDWSRWIEQQHGDDRIAAEALVALAGCRTMRAADILLDQYQGALATALRKFLAAIQERAIEVAQARLCALREHEALGRRLLSGWRVVIAGPPNVGKSSLLNALAGYERAIVFDQPGTTRDVVTVQVAWDGWPLEIADTAGLRSSSDPVEAAGIALAEAELARADLILWVVDRTAIAPQPPPAGDTPVIVVGNKSDLVATTTRMPACADLGIAVSALTGAGIATLGQAIVERLVGQRPPPGAAVPFTERHFLAVQEANESLSAGRISAAAGVVQSLLSRDVALPG